MKTSNLLRHKVSKKKRRLVQDGFDLDLSYITNQIIAMGFPSEKFESIYRNSMKDVQRFLKFRHGDKYYVYNLCSEGEYDVKKFDGRVVRFPFDDHNCPNFADLIPLCEDIQNWLAADAGNVSVIHCKAGKGRTGLLVCVYILFNGEKETSEEALSYYASLRTTNQKGVTIPSQIRWVYYFEKLMQFRRVGKSIPDNGPLRLNEILVGPEAKIFNHIEIITSNGLKHTSSNWRKDWKVPQDGGGILIKLPKDANSVILHRDFKVVFYRTKMMGKRRVWSFWANTLFIENNCLILDKSSLDKVNKDKAAPHFRLQAFFNDDNKKFAGTLVESEKIE
jgi:phosphatidylinositol-3,4,5-trisphosphate 3-phosphatase/dual-specificity protein phosphatase PTEN